MANRSQNSSSVNSTITMTRFCIDDDEDQIPISRRFVNKRPRFSGPASQSQPLSQPQRPLQQSQSQSQSHTRFVEEDAGLIPTEDMNSDSDSEGFEEEDDDEEIDVAGEEVDSGSADDEEVEAAAEGQNRQQQVAATVHRDATLARGGLRRCSTVAPVVSGGGIPVMLTDPDVLDCPICLDPLWSPIFQCENGHIACSSCFSKVKRKCPSCFMPIGYYRCRAIEKVIESVQIACKNTRYGCKETMSYSKKNEHEQMCPNAACFCPHSSCNFADSSKNLYLHFGTQHPSSATRFTYDTTFFLPVEKNQKSVILQEQHESVIFILNHVVQGQRRLLKVDCIGPSILKSAFAYKITAKSFETVLSLWSVPEIYAKWQEHTPKKNYLTVPFDFSGHNGQLPLCVSIKKARSVV